MTNGEKMQEMFPEGETRRCKGGVVFESDGWCHAYDSEWWNAEYKEPTTKNEAKYCDRSICLRNEYNNVGCEDCEVTKSQEPAIKNDIGVESTPNTISFKEMMDNLKITAEDIENAEDLEYSIEPLNHPKNDSSELDKNSKKLEKNFGESDCISRADAIRVASGYCHPSNVAKELANLPSVTPQEPFKPMVEIDLYSVIKQKYIEREVLDKIRAEVEELKPNNPNFKGYYEQTVALNKVLEVIDKYKAESEK